MTAPLGDKVRSGVRISFLSTVASGIVQACTMVILARLLGPVDYGFYVVCLSISALSVSFLQTALERAMVIEQDETTLAGRTLPLTMVLGVAAAAALGVCWIARWLTGWVVDLRVLAIMLGAQTIASLAVVPRALLRRHFAFGRIFGGELVGQVAGNLITAAILAHEGFGAFSLAIGFAVGQLIPAAWILVRPPPGWLHVRFTGLATLARTAWGVLRITGLEAVTGQITPIVVTSALGPVSLGLFNRVYNLVTLPIQLLVSSMVRVIISMLVAVAHDVERRRRVVLTLMRSVAVVITPLSLGIAGSSHAFVAVVLGPKWTAAVPIIPFLSIAVWANMIGNVLGHLAEATQRFTTKIWIQIVSTIVLVVALLIGGHWGLIGVSIGSMVAALIFAALYFDMTARIIEVPLGTLLLKLLPSWAAGAACFGAARLVAALLPDVSPALVLAIEIGACGVTAAVMLIALERALLIDLAGSILPSRLSGIVRRLLDRRAGDASGAA